MVKSRPQSNLYLFLLFLNLIPQVVLSQATTKTSFTVSMLKAAENFYQVEMHGNGNGNGWVDLKMPVWMPGYYQLMDYASKVDSFHASTADGHPLKWERADASTWRVYAPGRQEFTVLYNVKSDRHFVATNYIDSSRAFIAPPGLFMYPEGQKGQPVKVSFRLYPGWTSIATGLDSLPGEAYTFTAPDFDVLFDSPVLAGQLEQVPSFRINGVPHYFTAYNPGVFDRNRFSNDLKKVLQQAVRMMGEIPFRHYTFISIGPGGGGIEHLNSAAISFDGKSLGSREGTIRILSFLSHEYFHHYNVKRIRPVELGPFDYQRENRTRLLWVAEGITNYYDRLFVRKAGLMTEDELLQSYRKSLMAYENSPGHLFQSLAQSSFDTWSDGPFGRTGDDANKTISFYDKGAVMAWLLDFRIRHETANRRSLDDVMRVLYQEYYRKKNRGYTEDEFRQTCEHVAGVSLRDFFEYISTVKEVDYTRYLGYGGLAIDTTAKLVSGGWSGIEGTMRNDSLVIAKVDWSSPAWEAGLRPRQVITAIEGSPATSALLKQVGDSMKAGDILHLQVMKNGRVTDVPMILGTKKERTFAISKLPGATKLQTEIYDSWIRENK